ncbi:MAG: hypothetical protein QG670_597 [Thermoproteota archaeon]|nr:hypothetical protein [Thermoproteota archaeon]
MILNMFDKIIFFLKNQKKTFRIIILRDFSLLASGRRSQVRSEVGGYESLFLKRLGASPLEIGLVNSFLSLTSILFSVPAGWLTDRIKNMKKLYIASLGAGLLNYLAMAMATNWLVFSIVSVWRTMADRLNMPAKTIIDVDALSNKDRVMGLSIHRTITAVGGIIGPLLIAYIITSFGGLDYADSFRPVFLFQFVVSIVIFVIIWKGLDEIIVKRSEEQTGFLKSFSSIFQGSTALKILFIKEILQSFFGLMSRPFLEIYQVDVKLATAFILGYMGAGEMIVDVFLSLPISGLILKFGRRKIAYIGHLVGLLARSILFLTPASHPEVLILYSILGSIEGCMYLGWDAFALEVVPQEIRGKYLGVREMFVGIMGIFAPLVGGIIWEISPDYLWWINALQWTFVAFPILILLMEKYDRHLR